jgi:hypothetical protein
MTKNAPKTLLEDLANVISTTATDDTSSLEIAIGLLPTIRRHASLIADLEARSASTLETVVSVGLTECREDVANYGVDLSSIKVDPEGRMIVLDRIQTCYVITEGDDGFTCGRAVDADHPDDLVETYGTMTNVEIALDVVMRSAARRALLLPGSYRIA